MASAHLSNRVGDFVEDRGDSSTFNASFHAEFVRAAPLRGDEDDAHSAVGGLLELPPMLKAARLGRSGLWRVMTRMLRSPAVRR